METKTGLSLSNSQRILLSNFSGSLQPKNANKSFNETIRTFNEKADGWICIFAKFQSSFSFSYRDSIEILEHVLFISVVTDSLGAKSMIA